MISVEQLKNKAAEAFNNLRHFEPQSGKSSIPFLAAAGIVAVSFFLNPSGRVVTGIPESAVTSVTVSRGTEICLDLRCSRVIGRLSHDMPTSAILHVVGQQRWYQILQRRNNTDISKGFVPSNTILPH